eukprot:gb/GECG01009714.1/.p1 GENE.gb/GECG01009714.1/~~gb/GECG01009714.1/.p1  ORF type:complete len:263 (+),score=36.85 gb/GECG01009714.1/:1-789(+)
MQEVEYTAFSEVWMPFFEDRGWTGIIATESKTGVGVATFYCKKKLALQESRKVTLGTVMKKKFNDMEAEVGNWLPFGRLVGRKAKKKRQRIDAYWDKFNQNAKPMLLTLFEILGSNAKEASVPLLVGNVHLYWDPSVPDFKVLQAYFASIHMCRMAAQWFPATCSWIAMQNPYPSKSSAETNARESVPPESISCLSEEDIKKFLVPDKSDNPEFDVDREFVKNRNLDECRTLLPATILCGDFNSLPYLEEVRNLGDDCFISP